VNDTTLKNKNPPFIYYLYVRVYWRSWKLKTFHWVVGIVQILI